MEWSLKLSRRNTGTTDLQHKVLSQKSGKETDVGGRTTRVGQNTEIYRRFPHVQSLNKDRV